MRIIAGAAKGRTLRAPRSGTRPPTGRMREALFSSLGADVESTTVLDLYAGSGSFGLEALSRGANSAVFVEQGKEAFGVLERNVTAVGLGGRVVRNDVARHLRGERATYSLVFVDPPYALAPDDLIAVLDLLAPRVESGGTVVVHRQAGEEPPLVDCLTCRDRRRYGDAELWVFQKEEP